VFEVNVASMTTEPATAFTVELFQELERQGIDHVIARRAELVPRPPVGDDIDIVVSSSALSRVGSLLDELARKHGGICLDADRFVGAGLYVYFFDGPDGRPDVRHFHFQDSILHRGVDLVPGESMLRDRRKDGDHWRPQPGMETASLLLHDLVGKGKFRPTDLEQIRRLNREHPGALRSALEELVGSDNAARIEQALDTEDGAGMLPLAGAARSKRLWRRPFRFAHWWIQHLFRNFGFALRRRGTLVVLIGPDGSGKTTLVEAACRILKESGRNVERLYFGITHPMLPTKRIMKAFHGKRAPAGPRVNTGVPRKPGFKTNLSYFLGTVHSLIDQYLRYWVVARPRLARSRMLLCDRYFYDALASPAPGFLKRVLDWATIRLTPRADHVFVLEDDPQAIHDRKPELRVDEIARQQ
jgi:energy-coupling factor transporter ATP-binding protein EcfA2